MYMAGDRWSTSTTSNSLHQLWRDSQDMLQPSSGFERPPACSKFIQTCLLSCPRQIFKSSTSQHTQHLWICEKGPSQRVSGAYNCQMVTCDQKNKWYSCRLGTAWQDREGPAGCSLQEAPAPAACMLASRGGSNTLAVPDVYGLHGLDQSCSLHRSILGQHC